ncbi:hypothetical protein RIF29_43143 [Crotalaria pallida]|uniref:Uncharacterized protein n=1 Tax=Crotalaria pallida TaxID=3830 RepID=A0AAN9DZW9_CROPI
MVPCPWCVIPGAWSGAWCMVRDPWCMDPGAWSGARSVVPGAWCMVHGALSLVRDPWYAVHGSWCMVWCEVRGTRCMVRSPWCMAPCPWCMDPGAWCMVRDPWCMVPDPWCMDPGAWSGARSMVPGAWCMVHGALSLVRDPWYAVHGSWCMVWYEIRGTRCMVRDPWCLDPGAWSGARSGVVGALCLVPGGLAGCLPLHHGGSGWCAMGASPNAFSSHPVDVWSVFPWRGGDSRESSVEPNPGRTWPGACWSLGKIRAPRCDMVWHVGCKAEASRERSLVPIGNLGASHDAIISRHERTRVRSSPSAIGAGWHGFFRGGILGDACTRHCCVSRFGTLAKCIKGYHSLRIVPFGNKTWTLRCNPWGVHRETKRDVVALSLGSTCSSWKDAVLGDALTSNRLSRRFTKGRKPR